MSPYDVNKLSAAQLVQLYWRNFGVPTRLLRYFTVYGSRQRPDMACGRFVRAILEDRPLKIFGDGEQTRDSTFIDDVVATNLAAGKCTATEIARNIGSGSQIGINGVLTFLARLLGRPLHMRYTHNERGDPLHTLADISQAAELFGYRPRVPLQGGLAAQVSWTAQTTLMHVRWVWQ